MADLTGMMQAAAGAGGGGWDISTATYNGSPVNFFVVNAQESAPRGMFFKPDGTKMYIVGTSGDDVNEYDLSTAWNVRTASYVQNFSVAAQDSNPLAIFFKPDGTKMYVTGATGDDVNEYNLSSAWDVSTASYVQNFSVSAQETTPCGLSFKSDGTKMYVIGFGSDAVSEYNLSSAWDISTASYSQNFSVASQDTSPNGLFFKSDGTKMYVTGNFSDNIIEYNLSTAWNVSTASYVQSFSVASQEGNPSGVFFKSDGTVMYVVGSNTDVVFQYQLSSAWDLSTASYTSPTTDYFKTFTGAPFGLFFKPDGTKMYEVDITDYSVHEYSLSSAWDISTASYVQLFSIVSQDTTPQDLFFKSDGTKMYVIGSVGDDVNEYSLSSAWDISTASYVQNFSVATEDTTPSGLFFKPDGTKMYVIGSTNDNVYEYDLSSAWDISTASYVQNFSVASQETDPNAVFFKPDGTQMFVIGASGDAVYEYNLSSAWNISTASYSQNFSVAQFESIARGLFFKPDGTKMYIIGNGIDAVWSFDLT